MHEILANSNISTVKADTPDEYRKQFFNAVDDLKEKDLNPILLVDSRVSPEWIWQWIFLSDMPASHPKKKLLPKGIDIEMPIPEQIGHQFRFISATISGPIRPPNPEQIGRP